MKKRNAQPKNDTKQSDSPNREWLVKKAMQGNKDALQELCRAVAQDILFSTSRILSNQSDAEDAAQETLIRLCTNIQKLNDPKAFGAWLGRIITNESRRVMMKNSRNDNVVSLNDYYENIEEENEDFLPQEFAMKQEDRVYVIEIVDKLPDRQREAITLHYYNGLSVSETAMAMQVKHQVVSRYLKLARDRIKEELKKQENGAWLAVRGLAFLPVGAIMTQILRLEAESFAMLNSEWVTQALMNCPKIAGGTATVFGLAKIGAGLTKAAAAGVTKTAAAVVATAAVATGAGAGVAYITEKNAPPPIVIITSEYEVRFSGGDSGATQINPMQATAFVDTNHGEMKALEWWITPADSDEPLYSGEGGVVDKELAMLQGSEQGEYILTFRMEDAAGFTHTLSREFSINNTVELKGDADYGEK